MSKAVTENYPVFAIWFTGSFICVVTIALLLNIKYNSMTFTFKESGLVQEVLNLSICICILAFKAS